MVCVNENSSVDAKNAEFGAEMSDEWETLRKNVSKILKKDVSLKNVKHIAAVIDVMQNAGVDFKISDAASPTTSTPVSFTYPDLLDETDVAKNVRYTVHDSFETQSKRVVFEISDQMLQSLRPDMVNKLVYQQLVAGIHKALLTRVQRFDSWTPALIPDSHNATHS